VVTLGSRPRTPSAEGPIKRTHRLHYRMLWTWTILTNHEKIWIRQKIQKKNQSNIQKNPWPRVGSLKSFLSSLSSLISIVDKALISFTLINNYAYSRLRNKHRGMLIHFWKNFKKKKLKNYRNALIDVKMN
jgi:hypothetical protein